MNEDPSMLLAVAFPPRRGLKGALVTIADIASSVGAHRTAFFMGRREAVRTVLRRNLTVYARGNGNKARRRAQAIRHRPSLEPLERSRLD